MLKRGKDTHVIFSNGRSCGLLCVTLVLLFRLKLVHFKIMLVYSSQFAFSWGFSQWQWGFLQCHLLMPFQVINNLSPP